MPADVDACVLSNVRVSDDCNVVALEAPQIARDAAPGQFVMLRLSARYDPLLRRPFSIFEILRDDAGAPIGLSLLNKQIGVGTTALFNVKPNDRMACLGPLGRPFTLVDPPTLAWMVAGGVGLAPFAELAGALRRRGTPTTLFYGGRRASDLHHLADFERIGVQVTLATEDGSCGEHGLVTAPLARALDATEMGQPVTIYACGPTGMMRAVAESSLAHGRPSQVSLEPVMGCGLGGCYSCVVRIRLGNGQSRYVRSCLEGPVFAGSQVVWEGPSV